MIPVRLLAACAGLVVLALLASCGGDDDEADTASTTPSPTASPRDFTLCELLPPADVQSITGYAGLIADPHNGPGTLHFCTIYLDVPDCAGQCALSLDDLGAISDNANNTAELFRQTFESTNPDAEATYSDDVLGDESWLATVVYPDLPDWKLLYFQHNGIAYDIGGPRVPGYSPTEEQMIALGQTVIDNLQ